MPDDYYIFHSARWNKRYQLERRPERKRVEWHEADFLIFYPPKGVISLEVKDGGILYDRNCGWTQVNRATGSSKIIDPMYQAQRSMFYIVDLLKEKLPDVFCPVSAAVWFTSADKEGVRGEYPNNYHEENVLWANDMASVNQVQRKLEGIFQFFDQTRFNVDEESTRAIVNLIAPEFGAFESARTVRMASERLFQRMTDEQTCLLDYLDEQQVAAIHGNAGTGKTMLAIQKAQRLAEDDKVLFLCFNAFLKEHLQEHYACPNLTITNLDSLYTQKTRKMLPLGAENAKEKAAILYEFLCDWQQNGLDYKHIIIDEGQDFVNDHLEALHAITLETDGCFYVFYDKNQFVQGESLPTWIDDMDCRLVLNRNCRNTREIALTSTRPVGISEKKIRMRIDALEAAAAITKPRMFFMKDKESVLAALDARISKYVQAGVPREEIVVLTMRTLESSIISPDDYRLSRKNVLSADRASGKILFTTIRKFKGLEAEVIICVDTDAQTFSSERNRNAFYVGTSRAKLFLEMIVLAESDDDIIALSNAISGGKASNRARAMAAIASGLKLKPEHDAEKDI